MGHWIDVVMAALVLCNLFLVSTSRLTKSVKTIALQGLLLATLPILVEGELLSPRALPFAAVIVALKCIMIPLMLARAIRAADVYSEAKPFLGHTASLLIACLAFVGSRLLSARLIWPVATLSHLMVPVAFFTIFIGLFLIVTRHQAISQVIGYLQLEYGVFIFGMAHPYQHSFLVETAVILDILVAVMVMGIAIYHINREFDHIDTDKLSMLRDFKR